MHSSTVSHPAEPARLAHSAWPLTSTSNTSLPFVLSPDADSLTHTEGPSQVRRHPQQRSHPFDCVATIQSKTNHHSYRSPPDRAHRHITLNMRCGPLASLRRGHPPPSFRYPALTHIVLLLTCARIRRFPLGNSFMARLFWWQAPASETIMPIYRYRVIAYSVSACEQTHQCSTLHFLSK